MDLTLYFARNSDERGALINNLRRLDGAVKWAFLLLRRDEETLGLYFIVAELNSHTHFFSVNAADEEDEIRVFFGFYRKKIGDSEIRHLLGLCFGLLITGLGPLKSLGTN